LHFVAERGEADGAAGVKDVESDRAAFFVAVESGVLGQIMAGVPAADAVGDAGEELAPLGEPADGSLTDVGGFFAVDAADVGGEGTVRRLGDVAGAENPERETGFGGFDEAPNGDEDDEDGEDFDGGGDGFDEFGFFDDDAGEEGVFDVVFEVGFAFLEADFFPDAGPSFFEGGPIFAADVALENGEDANKNRHDGENNKGSDADH